MEERFKNRGYPRDVLETARREITDSRVMTNRRDRMDVSKKNSFCKKVPSFEY